MQKFLPHRLSKYSKNQRGNIPFLLGGSTKRTTLIFSNFGLQAIEGGMITPQQAEAARIVLRKTIRQSKNIKLFARIFCNHPLTKKGIGSRLGKGKGEISSRVDKVSPNRILFELDVTLRSDIKNKINYSPRGLPIGRDRWATTLISGGVSREANPLRVKGIESRLSKAEANFIPIPLNNKGINFYRQLYSLETINIIIAAFKKATFKLPLKTRIVTK